MKDYEDFKSMSEDELYDYKEVVGESWARVEYLNSWLKYQTRKGMEELVKLYQWGD